MLTSYERSQLERAVDCIRAGFCPKNLDELADILEHSLASDPLTAEREWVYNAPASRALCNAIDFYGLIVDDGATVGDLLAAIVRVESGYQKVLKECGLWKYSDRTGG